MNVTLEPVGGFGLPRVIETTRGAIVYIWPVVNGRLTTAAPSESAVLAPFAISSSSVPVAVPGFALTVHVVALPVTLVTLVPVPAGCAVSVKLEALTPVMLSLKVTVHATVAALVGLAPARLIETTFGAIVYFSPVVKGRLPTALLSEFLTPVELAMLMPTCPVAVPTVTGTVHVVPLPVGVPMLAPVEPVPAIAKFAAVTPVTLSLKVTV